VVLTTTDDDDGGGGCGVYEYPLPSAHKSIADPYSKA
jgi:hypothetical protein